MMPMPRPDEPAILLEHGPEWTRRWVERKRQDSATRFAWPTLDGRPVNRALLDALLPATVNHCAYCDHAPLGAGSRQTIDHFRPKGDNRFLDLAFSWENLFPCCDRCQQHKGDAWREGLLKPDEAGYSFSRYFYLNPFDGRLSPNDAAPAEDRERARTTILHLGLNEGVLPDTRKAMLGRLLEAGRRGETADPRGSYRFLDI